MKITLRKLESIGDAAAYAAATIKLKIIKYGIKLFNEANQ